MVHPELLLYPAILLVITFWGAKREAKGEFAAEALSLQQAKLIQASAAIAIILHHVTQRVTKYGEVNMGPISVFNDMGFFFTAIFLFFSGYGLMVSLDTKEDYLKGFLRNRLPAILIPLWLSNLVGIGVHYWKRGSFLTTAALVKNLLGLTLINGNAWFIIELVFLYLFFAFFFSRFQNRKVSMTLMFLSVLGLMFVSFSLGHDYNEFNMHWFRGEWWYNALPSFLFGLIWGQKRETFETFCRQRYRRMLILFGLLTPVAYLASSFMTTNLGYYVGEVGIGRLCAGATLLVQTLSELVFLTFVLLLNMKITLGNPIIKAVSYLQLALFLVHNYFLEMVFLPMWLSPFLLYGATILAGLLCAALLTPIQNLLIRGVRKCFAIRFKWLPLAIAALCALLFFSLWTLIRRSREFPEEYAALQAAQVGDTVFYGRFEMDSHKPGKERVTWLVLERTDAEIYLLSEYGLGGSFYNRQHAEVTFTQSDLHDLLNSSKYLSMFSREEKQLMIPISGDLLSLPTMDEVTAFFPTDKDRELTITDAAERSGTNINILSKANNWAMKGYRSSWWWLRGEEPAVYAPIVTVDGTIESGSQEVNRPKGAIRPVIRLRLE